jgi:hypothetical protein
MDDILQSAQDTNSLRQEIVSLILRKEHRAEGLIEAAHVDSALKFLKERGDFTVDYFYKEAVYRRVSPTEKDIAERHRQIEWIRRTDDSDSQGFLKEDDPYYECVEPAERRIFIYPPRVEISSRK